MPHNYILNIIAIVAGVTALSISTFFFVKATDSSRDEFERLLRKLKDGTIVSNDGGFEKNYLKAYYINALKSANLTLYFSLISATIGFFFIIYSVLSYDKSDLYSSFGKFLSGTVIDAVSSLFFVQSNKARKDMGLFFEKLRVDRINADARTMIDQIENGAARDELRMQLVLKYSGIEKLVVNQTEP